METSQVMAQVRARRGVSLPIKSIELSPGGKLHLSSGHKDKGHKNELESFLGAVRAGGAWPIPWEHLHAVSWASLAAVQSLRDGCAQELGLELGEAGASHPAQAAEK